MPAVDALSLSDKDPFVREIQILDLRAADFAPPGTCVGGKSKHRVEARMSRSSFYGAK